MAPKNNSSSIMFAIATSLVVIAVTAFVVNKHYSIDMPKNKRNKKKNKGSIDQEASRILKDDFQKAAALAPTILESASVENKLALYALYKQATEGDLPEDETPPSRIFLEQHYKFCARVKVRGMSKPQAMESYIQAVQLVKQHQHEHDENGDFDGKELTGGMGAPRVSTMANDEEESEKGNEESAVERDLRSAVKSCSWNAVEDREGNSEALKAVEAILRRGAKVNDADDSGQTALHFAADRGSLECLRLLLDHGADVNAADEEGISVLQAAVIAGNVNAVRLLLKHGANPDQEDMDGDTPRSCAQDDGSEGMKQLFTSVEAQ